VQVLAGLRLSVKLATRKKNMHLPIICKGDTLPHALITTERRAAKS
jgi:hypothetical protein